MKAHTRRSFATATAAAAAGLLGARLNAEILPEAAEGSAYQRADAGWFAGCRFGVSTHWTALSQAIHPADWRPFPETVARFNVERFADRIAESGAAYLIFTSCHALQWLAGPCEAIDRVLAGRTNQRDMVGELGRALRQRNVHFILYYNHSCNHGDDPAWEHAVGYHEADKERFVANLMGIVRELGQRHGELVKAWWFDSCFSLDLHGPSWGDKTTIPASYRFPWNDWVTAAKAGYANRLVTLSPGMMRYYLYTGHQDYESGEANDLVAVPAAQFTPDGLQAHRWVCLDNPDWVHSQYNQALVPARFAREHLLRYVKTAHRYSVPVTFNIDVDRNGEFLTETLALLREVRTQVA